MTVGYFHEYIILSLQQLPQSTSQSIHWRCIRHANLRKLLASDCNFASLIVAQVISCNLLIPFLTYCYIIIYYLFLFQTIQYTRIQYLATRNLYSTNKKLPQRDYLYLNSQWRRERDSNPRYDFSHTRVPGVHLQPLGHLSMVQLYHNMITK